MTDWIDDSNNEYMAESERKEHYRQTFGPTAKRTWQHLVALVKQDVAKLNNTASSRIRGPIRINKRDMNGHEMIPCDETLLVDNVALPAILLDVRLDVGATSIHIHQLRQETLEAQSQETDERLQLELDSNDQIVIKGVDGNRLSPEETSQHILKRFLDR